MRLRYLSIGGVVDGEMREAPLVRTMIRDGVKKTRKKETEEKDLIKKKLTAVLG